MDILTFSSLYPNNVDPVHGIFVERRLIELRNVAEVRPTVVAPVPWFPSQARIFGKYADQSRVAATDCRSGIRVLHPRYPLVPKIGMNQAARLMAFACKGCVQTIVEENAIKLIDAHYFYPDGVAASIIAEKTGLPYFITARGSDINLISRFSSPRRQMLRAAAGAKALIAVSNHLADAMRNLGMPGEKIYVLRNGVDLEFFSPGTAKLAAKSDSRAKPKFLTVGSLKLAKGHEIAIEFIAKLDGARLVVVGRGPDEAKLRRRVSELDIRDRVEFAGALEPKDLRKRYRAADALILMSEREGMPNVILESLACGTPVLASDAGGIPELVTAPEAGEVATTRSADGLMNAWERLADHGINSRKTREFANNLRWRETVEKLAELMHGLNRETAER